MCCLFVQDPSETVTPVDVVGKTERRAISIEDLNRMCEAAKGTTALLADPIGRNGLRPAEAWAVRWEFIDLAALTITVRAQLTGNQEFVDPKIPKAYRTIALDEITIDKLRRWKPQQEQAKEQARMFWQELDLVATTSSGRPIQRNNLGRSIRRLCEQLDIDPPITPYELRHTAISLQADAGHAAFLIADWAGTSERMISHVYRHRLAQVAQLCAITTGS